MAIKTDLRVVKKIDQNKTKKEETVLRLGTWNIRSLNGQEQELIYEFEKLNLDILAITETKKKGNGMIEMENGHLLIYTVE
ncbi:hypothetical protein RN001_006767 [Aquatica leii]|uniref:Craniofacial development protein 2-like n=1 Tax=Aquatica leii TaxID=1421715 RepID=A0AAN7PEF5_9COLE|nr:hypothetical protein RN001_006767 [Aquatica leii]